MEKENLTAEFSILELEDRLEFAELCDDNCGCNTGGTNTTCNPGGGTTNAYCPSGGGGGGDGGIGFQSPDAFVQY
jgi:hypothetical protein